MILNIGKMDWCGRPGSNGHSSFEPRDFLTSCGFRRRALARSRCRLVSGLDYTFILARSRFRCCSSSLYTFASAVRPRRLLLDHLHAGPAVLGDLINVGALHQAEADVAVPEAVAVRRWPSRSSLRFCSLRMMLNRSRCLRLRCARVYFGILSSMVDRYGLHRGDRNHLAMA